MNLNNLATSFMPEPTPSTAKNILTNDVDIKGTIKFENELIFDGKIEGEIVSDAGTLTLGKNADVRGEVRTKAVTVHGNVTGNISVSERCELKASSQLNGDLKASRIIIEEGATFIGKSEVTPKTSSKPDFSRNVTPATTTANSEAGRKQAAPASA
jgi:cytoskeletal protein CcmA (bactofilin family)